MHRFVPIKVFELDDYLSTIGVKREVTHIQLHHTWRPTKRGYELAKDKEQVIRSLYHYHTRVLGWSDIGQHFTVSPDGLIWDGRDLNKNPAGIRGHNQGGVSVEMIGNFDLGQEALVEPQLGSVLHLCLVLIEKFQLKTSDIIFHREKAPYKSCPGTSIDKSWFIDLLKKRNKEFDKLAGIKYLAQQDIINSPQYWEARAEESIPVWAATTIMARILKEVKK